MNKKKAWFSLSLWLLAVGYLFMIHMSAYYYNQWQDEYHQSEQEWNAQFVHTKE